MARDHQVGRGSPYCECAICAKTIRKDDAVEQRGLLVCPDDVDEPQEDEDKK